MLEPSLCRKVAHHFLQLIASSLLSHFTFPLACLHPSLAPGRNVLLFKLHLRVLSPLKRQAGL